MSKRQILVTGGAGFIGSHLVKNLLKQRFPVILLDTFKLSKNKEKKEERIQSIVGNNKLTIADVNILDKKSIQNIFQDHTIHTIIHLAAQASVPTSIKDPAKTIETNLTGSMILFEAAKGHVSHIIFASSGLVYGKNAHTPMKEGDPCNFPTSPYAVSMRSVEQEAFNFHKNYEVAMTGLRFFPVYGPCMREDLIIPMIIKSILADKPVTVFGDGKMKRSYTYIDDIVDGIISVMHRPNGYQLFNLGSPFAISLISLISLIEKILKKKVNASFKPARKEDLPSLYPDISKAKKRLGFSPKISLEEGLKRYIDWILNYTSSQ